MLRLFNQLPLIGDDLLDGLKELELARSAQPEAAAHPGSQFRCCQRLSAALIRRAAWALVEIVVLRPRVGHRHVTVQYHSS